MKEFINTLINNKNLKTISILAIVLLLLLGVFVFQSASDLPFVYSQF